MIHFIWSDYNGVNFEEFKTVEGAEPRIAEIKAIVDDFIKAIEEVVKVEEPNAKLRRFLEEENALRASFKTVKKLEQFGFKKYREIRRFIENPVIDNALCDYKEKLEETKKTIMSEAIVNRINEADSEYSTLLDEFGRRYKERHAEFNKWVMNALKEIERHEAFDLKPEDAKEKEKELNDLLCAILEFDASALNCKNCKR